MNYYNNEKPPNTMKKKVKLWAIDGIPYEERIHSSVSLQIPRNEKNNNTHKPYFKCFS